MSFIMGVGDALIFSCFYFMQRVVLDRSIGKLGLSIVGGADHVSRVFGQGRPGVYISKVGLVTRGGRYTDIIMYVSLRYLRMGQLRPQES